MKKKRYVSFRQGKRKAWADTGQPQQASEGLGKKFPIFRSKEAARNGQNPVGFIGASELTDRRHT